MATSAVINVGINEQRLLAQLDSVLRKAEGRGFNPFGNNNSLNNLKALNTEAVKFANTLQNAESRVLAFSLVASVLIGVKKGFTELFDATVNVEKALTDINVVLQLSSGNLKTFTSQLFSVARETAQSFDTTAKTALEFSRQGLGVVETLKRTRDALILTRLSGLGVAESTEAITAALNSFNKTILTSTELVSKFSRVDTASSASVADLAEGIKRVGNTAEEAGVGIDSLISLIATARETTGRAGSVIGNSLRTIFQRVIQSDTLQKLKEFNVEIEDTAGNILPLDQVLLNLSKTYVTLDLAQKNSITQLAAGKYQANVFKSIMEDLSKGALSRYTKNLKEANEATDEAVTRNEKLNKTLTALLSETGTRLKEVANTVGESSVSPLTKFFIGGLNDVLKNVTGGGEGVGKAFAKGIISGFTATFTNVSFLIIIAAVATKAILTLIQNMRTASRVFLDLGSTIAKNTAAIDKMGNSQNTLASRSKTVLQTEGQILTVLEAQNAVRAKMMGQAFTNPVAAAIANRPVTQRLTRDQLLNNGSLFAGQNVNPLNPTTFQKPNISSKDIANINKILDSFNSKVSGDNALTHLDKGRSIGTAVTQLKRAGINQQLIDIIKPILADNFTTLLTQTMGTVQTELMKAVLNTTTTAQANRQNKIKDLISQSQGFGFAGFSARKELKTLSPDDYKAAQANFGERIQSKALMASFASPFIGGLVNEGISPLIRDSRKQRMFQTTTRAVTDVVGTAGAGAFVGSIAGPPGALAGAAAGALIAGIKGISDVTKEYGNLLPEFEVRLGSVNEALSKSVDALAVFSQTTKRISDINEGLGDEVDPVKITKEKLKLKDQQAQALSTLLPDDRRQLLQVMRESGGDQEKIAAKAEEIRDRLTSKQRFTELGRDFQETKQTPALQTQEKIEALVNRLFNIAPIGGKSITQNILDNKDFTTPKLDKVLTPPKEISFFDALLGKGLEGLSPEEQQRSLNVSTGHSAFSVFEKKDAMLQTLAKATDSQEVLDKFAEFLTGLDDSLSDKFLSSIKGQFNVLPRIANELEENLNIKPKINKSDYKDRLKSLNDLILGIENQATDLSINLYNKQTLRQSGLEVFGVRQKESLQELLVKGQTLPEDIINEQKSGETDLLKIKNRDIIKTRNEELYQNTLQPGFRSVFESIRDEVTSKKNFSPKIGELLEKLKKDQEKISEVVEGYVLGDSDFDLQKVIAEFEGQLKQLNSGEGVFASGGITKELIDKIRSAYSSILTNTKITSSINTTELENEAQNIQKLVTEFNIELLKNAYENDRAILRGQVKKGVIGGEELTKFIQARQLKEVATNPNAVNPISVVKESFGAGMQYGPKDFYAELSNGAVETAHTIKSEFSGAFKEIARGSKDTATAFKDFLLNIGFSIQDKLLDIATNAIFNKLFGSIGSGLTSVLTRNTGGSVQKFSSGGSVIGGSGVKDDVPALLTDGEYVISKPSVQKYGKDFFEDLNSGVNTSLTNNYSFNDAKKPTAGEFNISPLLSNFALEDDTNPNNQLRIRNSELLDSYLKEKKAYDDANEATLSAFKKQKRNQLIGTYISAAVSGLGAYIGAAGAAKGGISPNSSLYTSKLSYSREGWNSLGSANSLGNSSFNYNTQTANYGSIGSISSSSLRYARGGMIFGGDSMTDNVPALLTGGEFVLTKSAVNRIGAANLDRLNRGMVPASNKYERGGLVNYSQNSNNSNGNDVTSLLSKLVTVNENINASLQNKNNYNNQNPQNNNTNPSNAAPTIINNNTFTINVAKDGNINTEGSKTDASNEREVENYKKTLELMRKVAQDEIVRQQLQGGALQGVNRG